MPVIEINFGIEGVQVFALKPRETIVGRHDFCDLQIESNGVSRRHARIFRRGDDFYIEDLQSINGTFLNRERLSQPSLLKDGDTIHFYRVSGVFRRDGVVPDEEDDGPRNASSRATHPGLESQTLSGTVRKKTSAVSNPSASSQSEPSEKVEERLHAVLKVVGNLGRSLDFDEVLSNILDGLFDVFPQSRRGNIWVIDGDTGDPLLRATKQTGSQTLCSDSLGPLTMSILDDVIAQRKAIFSIDEVEDELSTSVFDFQLRSSVCAPLPGSYDELLGAICIESDDGDNPFRQEDLAVLTSVSAVAGQAVEYARQHERLMQNAIDFASERARRKLAEEKLRVAESVQRTLYPASDPEIPGFDIAGAAHPTEEGCGDYFDFIPLPDGRLAIAVGDVSGHGLGAALYMVQTRSYLRAHCGQGLNAAELLSRLNRHLCEDLLEGTFVTLLIAILDPETLELMWASAGHQGFRLNAGNDWDLLRSTSIVAGLIEDIVYVSSTMQLEPGDVVILPTDGIPEASNPDQKMFGRDRMIQQIADSRDQPAREMVRRLCDRCVEFAGDEPIKDDMTCVLIKVH